MHTHPHNTQCPELAYNEHSLISKRACLSQPHYGRLATLCLPSCKLIEITHIQCNGIVGNKFKGFIEDNELPVLWKLRRVPSSIPCMLEMRCKI